MMKTAARNTLTTASDIFFFLNTLYFTEAMVFVY